MTQSPAEADFADEFTVLAPHYDQLMRPVPYRMWVDYLEQLAERYEISAHDILDVACGTGNVTLEFARRGYHVDGVDRSASMIQVAREKTPPELLVDFFVQDAAHMNTGRQYDLAVCLYDSLNYILDPKELREAFGCVARHLRRPGWFIFDMNSVLAFERELFTQDNLDDDEDLRYLWQSRYDPTTRICRVQMHFEVRQPDGTWKRFREVHFERAYEMDEVADLLDDAGLALVDCLEAYTTLRPGPRSERIFWITRLR